MLSDLRTLPVTAEEWPPRHVKQRWAIEGVDKPLPQLGTYVRLFVPGNPEDWLYVVEWVNHKTHKVGLRRVA